MKESCNKLVEIMEVTARSIRPLISLHFYGIDITLISFVFVLVDLQLRDFGESEEKLDRARARA
jgi:hypothetical protein